MSLKTLELRVVGGVRKAGEIMAAVKTLLEADRCLPQLYALFRDLVERTPWWLLQGLYKANSW